MQSLIGCPFKWVLTYIGKLRDPEIAALTDNGTMLGTLSHEILAETLRSDPADGLTAQKTADDLFVRLGPKLAAPLFLPGAPFQISFARKATADAARVLFDHLRQSGLPIIAVETPVSKKLGVLEFNGRTDLVVGDAPVVIDLKWSGGSYRREQLKNGTAFQVAAYAFMLQSGRAFPEAAYFILRDQRLIALKSAPFANAETVEGPSLQETWNALLAATHESLDVLKKGRIEALGIPLEDDTGIAKKDEVSDGRLILEPPCKFCSFGFLCGLSWGDTR
jgi:ATP-dependent helicase/nuclease subunit B